MFKPDSGEDSAGEYNIHAAGEEQESGLAYTVRYTNVLGERPAKIYHKYHSQEHDLFDVVNADYK